MISRGVRDVRVVMVLALAAAVCVLFAFGERASGQEDISERAGSIFKVQTVATGLDRPWGMDFLPNGDALVTERDSGRLLKVTPEGKVSLVRRIAEQGEGEGGLLGIALSPNYRNDKFTYIYYSTANDNRVVRFKPGGALQPVLTGIPVNRNHNGGRIAFGPDGKLYITTGDAGDTSRSQNKNSLGGKILRVNPDGTVPSDNPFGSPVWTLGHRNVQGIAWDAKGRMYASEFGQNTFDEINRIVKGDNYGWPIVEGRGNDSRFRNPIAVYNPDEASPSGAAIYKGNAIKGWNGDLLVAAQRGERLLKIEFDERGRITDKGVRLKGQFGRLRHVEESPGGRIWIITNNGGGTDRVIRIVPR